MKPIVLVVACMVAAILLSEPVFAAKSSLSDEAIDKVSGNGNDYTFNGNLNSTVSLASGASANSQVDSINGLMITQLIRVGTKAQTINLAQRPKYNKTSAARPTLYSWGQQAKMF